MQIIFSIIIGLLVAITFFNLAIVIARYQVRIYAPLLLIGISLISFYAILIQFYQVSGLEESIFFAKLAYSFLFITMLPFYWFIYYYSEYKHKAVPIFFSSITIIFLIVLITEPFGIFYANINGVKEFYSVTGTTIKQFDGIKHNYDVAIYLLLVLIIIFVIHASINISKKQSLLRALNFGSSMSLILLGVLIDKYIYNFEKEVLFALVLPVMTQILVQDILNLPKLKSELEKSKSLFENIFEKAPSAMIKIETDGKILLANKVLLSSLELRPDEVIGKHFLSFIAPADKEKSLNRFSDLLSSKTKTDKSKYRLISKSGIRWFKLNSTFFTKDKINPAYIISVGEDITEKELIAGQLVESKTIFQQLFDNINSGVAIYRSTKDNSNFEIIDINKAGQLLSKVNIDKVKGKFITEIFPSVKEMGLFEILIKVNNTGKPNYLPYTVYEDNRLKQWVENYVFKLPSGMLVAIYEDISEKQRAYNIIRDNEARYKLLANATSEAVFISDKDGIIELNSTAPEIFGYTYDELIGKNGMALVAPESKEIAKNNLLTKDTSEFEIQFMRKNGEIFPGFISSKIFIYKGSRKRLNIIRDLTTQKENEHALIKAKEKAELSDRLKSTFLAQVSHEIRTPVGAILSFSQLLNSLINNNSEEISDIFEGIESSGKRIIRTINLILNVSEIQTDSYDFKLKQMSLKNEVLQPIVKEFKYQANLKKLKLTLKCDENIQINADEYSTIQIFANLIDNAIKYTNEGFIKLEVTTNDSGEISVKVIDSGIGISEEFLPDLFKPFTQEEDGYTRKYEGTGLGLTLVAEYCKMNNIELSVESQKGKGTTFKTVFKPNTSLSFNS